MAFSNDMSKLKQTPVKQSGPNSNKSLNRRTKSDKAGWAAPKYNKVKEVQLDPNVIAANRIVCMVPDAPEIDFYKILRTQIQHRTKDKGWRTIMVTSVNPGEGKTLTTINLSITFAKEFNQTVLLVDSDLIRQNVHKYLGISSDKGLIDYLVNDQPLSDYIIWPGIDQLTLISGGRTIHDSSELLGSPRMKALVHEMKTRYNNRYVFFDVPPVLGGADAIVLAPLVDAIIMVVTEGNTSMYDIKNALKLLPKEKFLGFVLNRQKAPMLNYYYAYKLNT